MIIALLLLAPALGLTSSAGTTGKIAFTRATTSEPAASHVVVMNSDGRNQRELTAGLVRDFDPTWSPDGRRLAFIRWTPPDGNAVYIVNVDGSGLRPMTAPPSDADEVAWSPDGRTLAVSRSAPLSSEHGGVFLVDVATGHERRVGQHPSEANWLAWSPDGRRIAYSSSHGVVYVVSADGRREQRVTQRAGGSYDPQWSPDGTRIGFVTMPGRYDSIWVATLDGRPERRVTRHAYTEPGFAWSSDGRRIVYARAGSGGVYVINADGTGDHRLTRNPVPRHGIAGFAWSRDGRTIVYTTDRTGNGDIYAMGSDGRGQRRLTTSLEIDGKPIWWQPRLRPASPTTMSTDTAEGAALARYLSGMSWPMRATLLRARQVSAAIHGALTVGDPPFFGGVGLNCRKLRAVEPTGRRLRIGAILKVDPVVKLWRAHTRLAASYSDVRVGCVHARFAALAARDASRAFGGTPSAKNKRAFEAAMKTARAELSRFEATRLTALRQAARQWRTAVRAYSRSLGVRSPAWLERLNLSD